MNKKSETPERIYYKRLAMKSHGFRVGMDQLRWCDYWHTHFDMRGYSSLGWAHYYRHTKALFVAFSRASHELESYLGEYQVYASIAVDPKEAFGDALFVHTPNENETPFPAVFDGAVELKYLPHRLAPHMVKGQYRVFHYTYAEGGLGSYLIERVVHNNSLQARRP